MGLRIVTERSRARPTISGGSRAGPWAARLRGFLPLRPPPRSDHYLAMGGAGHGRCWAARAGRRVTLGALARETSRIRLGTLLSSATVLGRGDGRGDGRRDGRRTGRRDGRRARRRPIQLHPPTAHLVRRVATAHCALGSW